MLATRERLSICVSPVIQGSSKLSKAMLIAKSAGLANTWRHTAAQTRQTVPFAQQANFPRLLGRRRLAAANDVWLASTARRVVTLLQQIAQTAELARIPPL